MEDERHAAARAIMVAEIAAHARLTEEETGRGAFSARVLEVMARLPRHEFVPYELVPYAYVSSPLPVGYGKTISQPFINALMTDLLEIAETDIVLELGTGLGYQAAICAELAAKVYSIEIIEELANEARKRFRRLSYTNIEARIGNGYQGWPEHAPFDKIIVTAAPDLIPAPLITQLKPGGRMIIPAGIADAQQLILVEKTSEGRARTREILPVRFSALESADSLG